jgi:hypothetical protein
LSTPAFLIRSACLPLIFSFCDCGPQDGEGEDNPKDKAAREQGMARLQAMWPNGSMSRKKIAAKIASERKRLNVLGTAPLPDGPKESPVEELPEDSVAPPVEVHGPSEAEATGPSKGRKFRRMPFPYRGLLTEHARVFIPGFDGPL